MSLKDMVLARIVVAALGVPDRGATGDEDVAGRDARASQPLTAAATDRPP